MGLNPPPSRRELSSNPNSVTGEKEPSGLLAHSLAVNLFVAYQFAMPSSFCSRDPRDRQAHCAHSKVGAQCTGDRPSPIPLASGSFCLELFRMLRTPRVRAGRGTQSTCLVKPCLLHHEAKGHRLVTYPGTLHSNLSRATVTSILIKGNLIAGALPLGSL